MKMITYEEAKKRYASGNGLQKELAELCGMSINDFKKRLLDEGIYSKVVQRKREYYRSGAGIKTEEYRKAEIQMKKYRKNSRLDEKLAEARKLGMSYGQYSAMLRMREKKVTPLKPVAKPKSWLFEMYQEEN